MPINPNDLLRMENNDPDLTEILITNTDPLTAGDMEQLAAALKKNNNSYVKTLLFYGNKIGDEGAAFISTLEFIEVLALDQNGLTDKGAIELAKMKSLTYLSVASNEIGDKGLEKLIQLPNLQTFVANDNPFDQEKAQIAVSKTNKEFKEIILADPASNEISYEIDDKTFSTSVNYHYSSNLFWENPISFKEQGESKKTKEELEMKVEGVKNTIDQQLESLCTEQKNLYMEILFQRLEPFKKSLEKETDMPPSWTTVK